MSFWRRRWLDLLVAAAFLPAVLLIVRWRNEQFAGYGLRATYYEGINFKGSVWRTGVEHSLSLSDLENRHFHRKGFSATWKGTIVLPRSGRYVFATESDDGSWLDLDGRMVVVNGGVHDRRKVDSVNTFPAGPHAIEIRYFQSIQGASLRVYWTPAGRRGGLESIPGTLLFPDSPDQVIATRARSTPPRDFTALMGLLLSAAVCILVWLRRPLRRALRGLAAERWQRIDLLLFLLLVVGALAVRLWDLSGAGQTWDEDVYWSAGRNFVTNLLEGKLRASHFGWNLEHPALAKWLYGPATLSSEDFGAARSVAALLGALTCGFLFLCGRDLIGRRVGLLGGALSVVTPHLIAHSKVAGLEAPSGFFFVLGVWFFVRGLRQRGNSGWHIAAGLMAGLAASTRVTNLSLLLLMGLLYVVAYGREIRNEGRLPMPITLGLLPLVALVTFFGIWPYLWSNPLQHLGQMLVHWQPDPFQEYFLGTQREPPLTYFPIYLAVTMPAGLLLALVLGMARLPWHLGAKARAAEGDGYVTLLLWFMAPFVVALSPMARDGVRYLYPALAPACLLGAVGIDWIAAGLARLFRRPALQAGLCAALGTGFGLYATYAGLSVHPYYLDYYNELVGGPEEVERKRWFEVAWWGEGLREACAYVNRHAPKGARVQIVANPRHLIELRPDLVWTDDAQADYIIYNRMFNEPLRAQAFRIARVVRAGRAPLCWVYEREREQK